MTVKQLIDKLQKFPQDMPVVTLCKGCNSKTIKNYIAYNRA